MFTENWYSQGTLDMLDGLLKKITSNGIYVEIGCWQGKSSSEIAKSIFPKTLYCVDTWQGNIGEGENHPTVLLSKERDVYMEFLANMNELTAGNYYAIKMDGDQFLSGLKNDSIAFLHIDATHTYEAVRSTMDLAMPRMSPGSLICGDDYGGPVERAVRDFINNPNVDGQFWWHFKD
jgi:Methyltransferase domain